MFAQRRALRHLTGFGVGFPLSFLKSAFRSPSPASGDGDRALEHKLQKRKNGRKLCTDSLPIAEH
jgi:hypothetical protein